MELKIGKVYKSVDGTIFRIEDIDEERGRVKTTTLIDNKGNYIVDHFYMIYHGIEMYLPIRELTDLEEALL